MHISYQRKPYLQPATNKISRTLPPGAQILVKVGDTVRPEKIVGIGRKSAGFRTVNAAQLLGIKPSQLKKYLTKTVGSYIAKDEVIAEVPHFLGIRHKTLQSPSDGIIQAVEEKRGTITLQYTPEEIRVVAGVHGEIAAIDPDGTEITIKTKVLALNGTLGLGKRREGSILVVGQPDLPISEKQISPTWENKIIIGGSLVTKQVLYHCVALKVQGIVCGGMHWEDYITLVGTRGKFEDIGISIILTEGYGNLPMPQGVIDSLKQYEGKFSFISGGNSRLVIPDQNVTVSKEVSEVAYITLKEGGHVRMHTLAHRGEFGTIVKLIDNHQFENGILAEAVAVKLNTGEQVIVPVTSVEVLEDHAPPEVSNNQTVA